MWGWCKVTTWPSRSPLMALEVKASSSSLPAQQVDPIVLLVPGRGSDLSAGEHQVQGCRYPREIPFWLFSVILHLYTVDPQVRMNL